MSEPLIRLLSPTLRYTGVTLQNPHRVEIPHGLTAVIGPNGAGKTTLAKILERGWNFGTNRIESPHGRIAVRYVEFSDIHTLSGYKAGYYQQRYESGINIEVPSVAEVLGTQATTHRWREYAEAMNLFDYLHKPVNALSSGELRKLLVIHQLTEAPRFLILDNPYIGLDPAARSELNIALKKLIERGETSVMLLVGNINEIPNFATAVLPVDSMKLLPLKSAADLSGLESLFPPFPTESTLLPFAPDLLLYPPQGTPVIEMRGCTVSYGAATIFRNVNWEVKMGEHWGLSGPNGSGKSTLLSLIHADHPQAYANPLSLFGRKRGSGESIWDIKKRIGYISPEMHLFFNGAHSLGIHVVAQGLNDTVGQYKILNSSQIALADRWLSALSIRHLAQRPFRTLSSGEQRMLLLARTLVKNPPLLILDEPLHGLDQSRKKQTRSVIDSLTQLSEANPFTMIYVTHRAEEAPSSIVHRLQLPARGE